MMALSPTNTPFIVATPSLLPSASQPTWAQLTHDAATQINTTLGGWPTYQVNPNAKAESTPAMRQESYLDVVEGATMATMAAELEKEIARNKAQRRANRQPYQPLPTPSQLNHLA